MVDTPDLSPGEPKGSCGFESRPGYKHAPLAQMDRATDF